MMPPFLMPVEKNIMKKLFAFIPVLIILFGCDAGIDKTGSVALDMNRAVQRAASDTTGSNDVEVTAYATVKLNGLVSLEQTFNSTVNGSVAYLDSYAFLFDNLTPGAYHLFAEIVIYDNPETKPSYSRANGVYRGEKYIEVKAGQNFETITVKKIDDKEDD